MAGSNVESKKHKAEPVGKPLDPKAAAKKKLEETKAAKAAKAAIGTKSITGFFKKAS